MIPKVIHYCWFGNKDKPQEVVDFINTWKEHLPDYEIKEWNESNFDISLYDYAREAYECKKFAFVSDVCRLYALQEGGIYLDTDVEVLKSFDEFLNLDSFVGMESSDTYSTAIIGASPNTCWIKTFLDEYNNIHFKKGDKMDVMPNTVRLRMLMSHLQPSLKPTIFAQDFFSSKDYKTGKINRTNNTVSIHHFNASWVTTPKVVRLERRLWKFLHLPNFNIVNKLVWNLKLNKFFSW